PLIGPAIDRVAGGRRLVIQLVAVVRVVLMILMARYVDDWALFPLVFASLVLQKTYVVSKSALVPSTVRSETELVEANSKLGLIAGLTGAVAVVPAGLLLQLGGSTATLVYGAGLFVAAFVAATRLPPEVVATRQEASAETIQLHTASIRTGALAMTVLRGAVGFTLFLAAFWLRAQDSGTLWFGAVVAVSAVATMIGNALAPRLRDRLREETMLSATLVAAALVAVVAAVLGGAVALVLLAGVLNFVASIGRLSFESIVQRDAPGANQGRAFARFETRFQLSWAAGAFIAVALQLTVGPGALAVAVATIAASVYLRVDAEPARRRSPGRSRGPGPRSRSASGRPRPR
ncbi:MAG: MFS transporter, partial [Actinomycetota bacterium]